MAMLKAAAAVLITVGMTGTWAESQQAVSAAKTSRGSKADLTPQSFPNLHALIRPQPNEWRHLKVNWITDIVPVRKKAAAEDKPIVVMYTGGAGALRFRSRVSDGPKATASPLESTALPVFGSKLPSLSVLTCSATSAVMRAEISVLPTANGTSARRSIPTRPTCS